MWAGKLDVCVGAQGGAAWKRWLLRESLFEDWLEKSGAMAPMPTRWCGWRGGAPVWARRGAATTGVVTDEYTSCSCALNVGA